MYRRLIERGFVAVLVAFLAAAALLGSFLPRVSVDASTDLLLDEHDPDLTYYAQSRRFWPSDDEFAIVCCRRDDWFTQPSIEVLRGIRDDLAKAPYVRRVVSMLSIPLLRQGLPFPPTLAMKGVDLGKARTELTQHAVARGTLVSDDGRDVVLLAYLDQPEGLDEVDRARTTALEAHDDAAVARLDPEYSVKRAELRRRRLEMVAGVRAVAAKWGASTDGPIRLSGLPIINVNLIEHVSHDLDVFGVVSFAMFTLAFAAVYRRFRWTALPIVACTMPVVLVLGAMAALGQRLTVITANLPILLFVIMLPYTVYFVERYRERRAGRPDESHVDSTAGAARDIWLPCLYSCTTTMAGFASLLTSGVKPVWWFGLMMTIGLATGLACAFLFLPAAARPLGAIEDPRASATPRPSGVVRALERLVLARPLAVALSGLLLLAAAVWGVTRISVENKFIDYFWPRSEVYSGLEYIDRHMGGTTPLDIVLTSRTEGFFKTAAGIDAIRAASQWIGGVPEVGNVTSLATLVDEAKKSPAFAALPPERIVAIGERFKDLESLVRDVASPDFRTARVLVRFKETAPTLNRRRILDGLREELAKRPELADLGPRVTGVFLLYSNMLQSLLASQKDTFGAVVTAIYVMLVTLFATPRFAAQSGIGAAFAAAWWLAGWQVLCAAMAICGVLSLLATLARADDRIEPTAPLVANMLRALALSAVVLLPQVLPAVVVLGVMGWTGIPLDLITVTIAAIAMGVGIDAAIQYTVRYRIELAATGGDRRAAVTRSHATIGRAIWIATSIMVVGFSVLALSDFVPTVSFGLFNALAMLMGQFAALTVLPSLFLLLGVPRHAPAPADAAP